MMVYENFENLYFKFKLARDNVLYKIKFTLVEIFFAFGYKLMESAESKSMTNKISNEFFWHFSVAPLFFFLILVPFASRRNIRLFSVSLSEVKHPSYTSFPV